MGVIKQTAPHPWRIRLVPASFKGVEFFVEQQARTSGRRTVVHEYPKRDEPYAEDMGRHAIRYQVTGYVLGPSYHIRKDELIAKLEESDAGTLVDPYVPKNMHLKYASGQLMFMCDRYSVTEVRERGGYCLFEMTFVEAGIPGNSPIKRDTKTDVSNSSQSLIDRITTDLNLSTPRRTTNDLPPAMPVNVTIGSSGQIELVLPPAQL